MSSLGVIVFGFFLRKCVTFRKSKHFPLLRLRERKIMVFSTFSDIYVFCLVEKYLFSFEKWKYFSIGNSWISMKITNPASFVGGYFRNLPSWRSILGENVSLFEISYWKHTAKSDTFEKRKILGERKPTVMCASNKPSRLGSLLGTLGHSSDNKAVILAPIVDGRVVM